MKFLECLMVNFVLFPRGKSMSNANFNVNGSIHQTDSRFSDVSEGGQCALINVL